MLLGYGLADAVIVHAGIFLYTYDILLPVGPDPQNRMHGKRRLGFVCGVIVRTAPVHAAD